MTQPRNGSLSALLEHTKLNDPELYNEYIASQRTEESPTLIEKASTKIISEKVQLNNISLLADNKVEEAIALARLRPVLVIRDNKVVPEFEGPDVEVWKARIMDKDVVLNGVIPSIGRVEVKNNILYNWVGTGWLIDTNIIVTNRHVASLFSQNNEGFAFKMGYPSGYQSAQMDFLEEDQRTNTLEFAIDRVLWMAENDNSQPDVAFLKVKSMLNGPVLPKPIPLADTVGEGEVVVTIGYPARDPDVPDQELVLSVFKNIYDKKRLAPGIILKVKEHELQHDCSTLGGNSGSAVISLATGKAVGLHFAGLYLQANFAVPAAIIKGLLSKLKSGTLTRLATAESLANNDEVNKPVNMLPVSNNTFTFEATIPIKITVDIGGISINSNPTGVSPLAISQSVSRNNSDSALDAAREALIGKPEVLNVRKGYRFKNGWITNERVIVVELTEKKGIEDVLKSGQAPIPAQFYGVGVDVRTAPLIDQLQNLGIQIEAPRVASGAGVYREPPFLKLNPVKEVMSAIFHVSPDSGFPNLKAFLERVEQKLTATMYEWEVNHISNAIFKAINVNGRTLTMVTQKKGTKAAVADMQLRLGNKFKHVWASVGAGKIVPSAYHIKVATRDRKEFWLSSGNWKDSNQADINPAVEHSTLMTPLREHNREWHAIIKNEKLAGLFEDFINWDFQEAQRVPADEAPEMADVEIFIPDEDFLPGIESPAVAKYFSPLVIINRELEIQPFLTPDWDDRGTRIFMDFVTKMIDNAKAVIYVENQSFNLLDSNNEAFERFFAVLKKKQDQGVEVKIIFRDGREFGSANAISLERLLERIKDFGINTDNIKVQTGCHTKAIIVDPENPDNCAVMFGSHNLTNAGALFNRDASLLLKDKEVVAYYTQIFKFDWEVLSKQFVRAEAAGVIVAVPGEPAPLGFKKVKMSDLLDPS
ncbi:serine protease [Flavobacterium noncentrifugens]|uniref:Serine protease n=1 Tax=Flavobacterium noncentrifugens TaxID=1128970 RepID=A0A1G8WHJ3_9FLAO|nr:phospholipase D-like domain-containing protein [Flavobacterium noncentrifugens]GEP50932.1 serine protease [Flavobacterium noncentrifugens]SDJ77681.1 Phosphatidylserine/phosphatidylglycerophosphate/cardiolipin synthase [Flavobacterium noncentrifugens]